MLFTESFIVTFIGYNPEDKRVLFSNIPEQFILKLVVSSTAKQSNSVSSVAFIS